MGRLEALMLKLGRGVVTHYLARGDTFDWIRTCGTDSTFCLSAHNDTPGGSYPHVISAGDTTEAVRFVRDILGLSYAESSGPSCNPDPPCDYGCPFSGAIPTGDHVAPPRSQTELRGPHR